MYAFLKSKTEVSPGGAVAVQGELPSLALVDVGRDGGGGRAPEDGGARVGVRRLVALLRVHLVEHGAVDLAEPVRPIRSSPLLLRGRRRDQAEEEEEEDGGHHGRGAVRTHGETGND